VKCSPALKWSLALLLPLTLGWKLASKPDDPSEVKNFIVEFLAQQQFNVIVTKEAILDIHVIEASSGSCRLLVGNISPYGVDAELVQHFSTATDRTFIVFRGTIYDKQPVLLTTVNYLWFRLLSALGLVSHIPPVLAVVSSCDAEQLPWSLLRF
jgi:hypothetical protein